MRAGDAENVRKSGSRGLDDVEPAEHRGGEEVHARIIFEEKSGDVSAAHVRSAAERRFEITATPIPGRVDERRLCNEHLLHFLELPVPGDDELLH
jgi:hypothetical protein